MQCNSYNKLVRKIYIKLYVLLGTEDHTFV